MAAEAGEPAAGVAVPAAEPKAKYDKKRKAWAAPEGFSEAVVADVVKPQPCSTLSKYWDHVTLYVKVDGSKTEYVTQCKQCGSTMKNPNLRSTVISAHADGKAKTGDYGHKLLVALCSKEGGSSTQTLDRFVAAKKPEQLTRLVHWMTDSLTPPRSLTYPSWAAYNRSVDPDFKKQGEDAVYSELSRQIVQRKDGIKAEISAERKGLGGAFRHFHYEL
eukprot:gene14913-6987_t